VCVQSKPYVIRKPSNWLVVSLKPPVSSFNSPPSATSL
jgi:hypothetical protein